MPYGTYSTKPTSQTTNSGAMLFPDGTDTSMLETLFQPLLNPSAETIAFNARIRWFFLGLLLALQCVTIAWFVMICRVVVRVIRGEGADDSRSDDEEGDEDEDEAVVEPEKKKHALHRNNKETLALGETEVLVPDAGVKIRYPAEVQAAPGADKVPRYIEVESSSEDYSPAASGSYGRGGGSGSSGSSAAKRKGKGISSGLNLGEHKDILNRIGCLSEEQLARERERAGSMSPSPRPGSGVGGGK